MEVSEDNSRFLPISTVLINNSNSNTINNLTLHKILSHDFLGLDVYYPTLAITLSIEDGQFSVTNTNSAIKLASNKKSVTLDWDEDFFDNLKNISISLDDSFYENIKNGVNYKTTLSLSVNNAAVNEEYTRKVYIGSENYAASFFESSDHKCSFINGIKGLTAKSFKNNEYTNDNVIDAEKNANLNNNDTYLCWAAATSNMLIWTKWAEKGLDIAGTTNPEDVVFNKFKNNFTDEGSSPYYGIKWFFNGEYPNYLGSGWSVAKKNSGNFLNLSSNKYVYYSDTIDNFVSYIFSGDAVSLSIGTNGSSHAITCWGIQYDSNYKVTDKRWLTGIYITDSDDSKYTNKPKDILQFVKVSWVSKRNQYKLDSSYSSDTYYIDGFVALARVYPENFASLDTRKIIAVNNNEKSIEQIITVNQLQLVYSGGLSKNDIINGGESYIYVGARASNIIIQLGKQFIHGSATNVTVKAGANLHILDSGRVTNATIESSAKEIVSRGIDKNATIYGQQNVLAAGSAYNAKIYAGGIQNISGYASGTQIYNGGILNNNSGKTSVITVNSAGILKINSGSDYNAVVFGEQIISKTASAFSAKINSGGIQTVYGKSNQAIVSSGGKISALSGTVSGLTINSAAYELISGKSVQDFDAQVFGTQEILLGSSYRAQIKNHGEQIVSKGQSISATISAGGCATIKNGGQASHMVILENGFEEVAGTHHSGQVYGSQLIASSGIAYAVQICGGRQSVLGAAHSAIVSSNGRQIVLGLAASTTILSGGIQDVYGTASKTIVSSSGKINVYSGATISNVEFKPGSTQAIFSSVKVNKIDLTSRTLVVNSGANASSINVNGKAKLEVKSGGKCVKVIIANNGTLNVKANGIANKITVQSNGRITAQSQAILSNMTLKSAAICTLASNTIISGNNIFGNNAKISGGAKTGLIKLADNAAITISNNVDMSKLYVDASNTALIIKGKNNTLAYALFNDNTSFTYNLTSIKANDKNYLLNLTTSVNKAGGVQQIIVNKNQSIGLYKLSNNLIQAKNTAYVLNLESTNLGTVKLNGKSISKNGVTYNLKLSNKQINFVLSLKAGKMLKNKSKKATLTGNTNSDIFYGGTGNDIIKGQDGRDISVYDNNAWGKDVIKKTNGTMTILFSDIAKNQVKTSLKNDKMIIAKANNSSQQITVEGWDSATHNLVFTSGLSAFNKYLQVANPTTKQITSARTEVWKKSGLLSS